MQLTRFLVILVLIVVHFQGTAYSVWTDAILYLVIIVLSIITVTDFWKKKKALKINFPELFLSLFLIYLIINNGIKGTLWDNERLLIYLTAFFTYFVLIFLYKRDKKILDYLFYGIVISTGIEITVGFGQIFGMIPNSDPQFILGGLFANPAAYAGHLGVVSPFILALILHDKEKFTSENFYYILIICFISTVLLIIISDSRGAWLSLLVGSLVVLNYKYKILDYISRHIKTLKAKLIAGVVVFSGIVLILFVLYQYKPESAFGRLFVWKVSKEMALEKPITGNGFGFFEGSYGKVQAQYFAEKKVLENEKAVADYVTCAYNEFLEMFIESGFTGVALFSVILFFALFKRSSQNNSIYHIASKASLISLLLLSMVSYPFKLMPNLFVMVVCLFIAFRTGCYKTFPIHRFRKPLAVIFLSIVLSLSFFYGRYLYGTYHFKKGYAKVIRGNLDGGLSEYSKAFRTLNNNGRFLFYYGSAYYLKQGYKPGIVHLKKATKITSNPNAFITLGNSLMELERYKEAERAYKTASGITPSKLYPRYLLAKLYIKKKDIGLALKTASLIVTAAEKVPTTAGQQIKNEMRELIDQYSKPDVEPLKTKIMSP